MVEHERKESFEGVLRRRAELHEAAVTVERACSSPVGTGLWHSRVGAALRRLGVVLDEHVRDTESPGGLLEELVERSPRLARAVERLREEHRTMTATARELLGRAERGDSETRVLRDKIMQLVRTVSRHQQRAADLMYQAYELDVGAGD